MSDLKPSTKFHIGDLVRVKHGVADIDYPDIPMGGWVGRISEVGGGSCLIRWSTETLENVHPVYRNRCERDGGDFRQYWVNVTDLEPAPIEPLEMEQPTAIVTRPLSPDNQQDRICVVFGLTSDDLLPCHSEATELTYLYYLKRNLTFPFPARCFDPIENRKRDVTVTGFCDDLPLEDGFRVVCEVLDGGKKGRMPLSKLEVEPGNPNYQMVDDYIAWLSIPPRRGRRKSPTTTIGRRLGRGRWRASVESTHRRRQMAKCKPKNWIEGRWFIESMTEWDRDYIDEEVRGYFEFDTKDSGDFQFAYVQGQIDYRLGERDGKTAVEFSWDGHAEMDAAQGRGWLVQEGDKLKGMFYFHDSDESGIVLKREPEKKRPSPRKRK